MELNKQVPSLELCKKLKELGYPQEGLFWWKLQIINGIKQWNIVNEKPEDYKEELFCVAPTVAELGERLPMVINDSNGEYMAIQMQTSDITFVPKKLKNRMIKTMTKKWKVWYDDGFRDEHEIVGFIDETEADARAKMLIYLLENKLISLEGKDG